ncbi:acyltransferase family protein [Agrococcus jejuensis]|nr:acyltransferase family protein [Agrococcus jejuensis]
MTSPAARPMRRDIQVLRAVAVGVVLLYHLWPNRFPGGFVGVDVFFVVSGLLITSHLLREAETPRGIRPVAFWANRVRRLLPLAVVVLVATMLGVLAWAPASQVAPSMRHAIASMLSVENWMLASDAVDYLARDQQALPTQHFWSLSVEEQFYVVWPLLLVAAVAIAMRARRARATARPIVARDAVRVTVLVVLVASFVASILQTWLAPGPAYFATTTRAWELAAGAALAVVAHDGGALPAAARARAWRAAASWAGLALIVGTTLLLPAGTPFPGVAALLPVVAAVLWLVGGEHDRWWSPAALGRVRPVVWMGDVSYGIYLWHWPLIVLVPFAIGADLTSPTKVGIVAATLALAGASAVLVERPFRFGRVWRARPWRAFALGAAGAVLVVAVAGSSLVAIDRERADAAAAAEQALADSDLDPGPLDAIPPADPDATLVPTIAGRADDRGVMYDCFDNEHLGPRTCTYGPDDADVRVAIVGDSHAAHLIPGIVAAADAEGWRVETYVGRSCDAVLVEGCTGGASILADLSGGDYDLVVASGFRDTYLEPAVLAESWQALRDAGLPLVLVGDVPLHPQATFACVDASQGDPVAATACTTSRAEAIDALPSTQLTWAAEHDVPTIDLTAPFCDPEACASVLDGVVVYQDSPSSHLTATMSTRLAPLWRAELGAILAAGG